MKYEIMYIIRPDIEENTLKEVVRNFEKVLTDNKAKIINFKEMGQRRLAYEINDFKSGYYYVYQVEVNDYKNIKEFDRLALINDNIIRHLIIRLDD